MSKKKKPYMTVGRLEKILSTLPKELRICMSGDPEGNNFYGSLEVGEGYNWDGEERELTHHDDYLENKDPDDPDEFDNNCICLFPC